MWETSIWCERSHPDDEGSRQSYDWGKEKKQLNGRRERESHYGEMAIALGEGEAIHYIGYVPHFSIHYIYCMCV